MLANPFNFFNLLLNTFAREFIYLIIMVLTDDWRGKKKLDKQAAGCDAIK